MTSEVHHELRDGVALVTLDRPVANALAPSLRAELRDVLADVMADDAVRAVVLRGAGNGFSSGVDISQYDGPLASPWISDLCTLIENAPKPVVACLHGAVLGAGFELALAAHARVASRQARLALPEVTLGLIPGGGATQRLPRIVGAQAALEFMLSGQIVAADDPRMARLCDRLVESDPLEAALDLARDLAGRGTWRRTCDFQRGFSDPERYRKAVGGIAAQLAAAEGPEHDVVKCVEAAQLLPFDRGLEFEGALFQDRLNSPEARARRHLYTAERRAAIFPEVARVPQPQHLNRIALLGDGALLAELAVALLDGGKHVDLIASSGGATEAVLKRVAGIYEGAVARKRLDASERDARLARLARQDGAKEPPAVDLVMDSGQGAISDDLSRSYAGAIWAVLGDGHRVTSRSEHIADPSRCLGLRLYRPAHSVRLAEIAVPDDAEPAAVSAVARMLMGLGRTVIRCSGAPGGVGDTMHAALCRAGLALAQAGVSPYEVDAAACDLGFSQGPFRMMDAEGLEPELERIERLARLKEEPPLPGGGLLQARIADGATGQAVGRGFYLYPETGDPQPDATVSAWSDAQDTDADLSNISVQEALHAALVNAAARLVVDKVVQRASDIDVVMVKGLGFDSKLGGPLLQADLQGMLHLLRVMRELETLDPTLWHPDALIEDMVKNGRGFFGRSI